MEWHQPRHTLILDAKQKLQSTRLGLYMSVTLPKPTKSHWLKKLFTLGLADVEHLHAVHTLIILDVINVRNFIWESSLWQCSCGGKTVVTTDSTVRWPSGDDLTHVNKRDFALPECLCRSLRIHFDSLCLQKSRFFSTLFSSVLFLV